MEKRSIRLKVIFAALETRSVESRTYECWKIFVCPRLWRAVCSACSVPLCIDPLSAISLPQLSLVNVKLSSVAFVLYYKFTGEHTAEFGDRSRSIQRTTALVKSVAASARRSVDLWLSGVYLSQETLTKPNVGAVVAARPAAAIVPHTSFVQGGDHFLTSSVASNVPVESSPVW